jgi:outer membrane protein assembly factor BamB
MQHCTLVFILWSVVLGSSLRAADAGEAIWSAARKGDAKAVEALLAKGADVNAKTSYGVTALWLAAYKGHRDVVQQLLRHKADVNVRDGIWGSTPLGMAVDGGHVEIVRLLLQAGARDADAGLLLAAQQGRAEVVRAVLDKAKVHPEALDAALALTPAKQTKIAALLRKAGAKPLAKAATKADREALEACAGTYENSRGERFSILVQDGILTTLSNFGERWVLKAAGRDTFHTLGQDGVRLTFARSGAKVNQFTLRRAGGNTVFKVVEDGEVDRAKLPKYQDKPVAVAAPGNWPSFRGMHASGVADGQGPPVAWDVAKGHNIRWKTPIPGFGHSCPIVWGDRVFVTTAVSGDPKATFRRGLYGDVDSVNDTTTHTWSVYCLDKRSGKILWEKVAHRGVPRVKRHLKASHANCTPATDGRRVVACFGSEGLYCYDLDGRLLWKRDLGFLDASFFLDPDYQWGFGSSPVLYRNLVILQCDVGKGSFIAAYDLDRGRPVWTTPRDEVPSWGTPTVYEGQPRDELVTNATNTVRGYDPRTGRELWRLSGNAQITVPTPVVGHGLIFVTSGYRPIQPIYAIRPGASGDISLASGKDANAAIAWSKRRGGPYLPTPIVYGDYLYTCSNNGIVACYAAATGKQVYRQRLGGSAYTASPLAADGKLYFTSEEGDVRVVRAGSRFELLAVNKMGDPSLVTPAIADGMIFVRTQHFLFGIGRPPAAKATGRTQARTGALEQEATGRTERKHP